MLLEQDPFIVVYKYLLLTDNVKNKGIFVVKDVFDAYNKYVTKYRKGWERPYFDRKEFLLTFLSYTLIEKKIGYLCEGKVFIINLKKYIESVPKKDRGTILTDLDYIHLEELVKDKINVMINNSYIDCLQKDNDI